MSIPAPAYDPLPTDPTSRWLATAPVLPPLDPHLEPAAAVGERLLLLCHYGVNWQNSWITDRRDRWWDDIFPSRAILPTWRHRELRSWWNTLATELQSSPRTSQEREELARLLAYPAPTAVLGVIRTQILPLVLRVRIVSEHVRAARSTAIDGSTTS